MSHGHILLVIDHLRGGGAASQMMILARTLNANGYRITIFTYHLGSGPHYDLLCKDGIEANPYLAFSDYQLSRIYTELKMFNKAYHHIEKAYKLSPNIISISALYEALKEIQNNNVN